MIGQIDYRGFHIIYDQPPIPDRKCDWQYWHDDYDGADDANDDRHGSAKSLNDCRDEIDTYWKENKMEPADTPKFKFMQEFSNYITKEFGPRCSQREPGCAVCELWAAFDLVDTLIIEDY